MKLSIIEFNAYNFYIARNCGKFVTLVVIVVVSILKLRLFINLSFLIINC